MTDMDRERLLKHLQTPEERAVGSRLLDLAERALRDDKPTATDFLDPLGAQVAQSVLGSIPESLTERTAATQRPSAGEC